MNPVLGPPVLQVFQHLIEVCCLVQFSFYVLLIYSSISESSEYQINTKFYNSCGSLVSVYALHFVCLKRCQENLSKNILKTLLVTLLKTVKLKVKYQQLNILVPHLIFFFFSFCAIEQFAEGNPF